VTVVRFQARDENISLLLKCIDRLGGNPASYDIRGLLPLGGGLGVLFARLTKLTTIKVKNE